MTSAQNRKKLTSLPGRSEQPLSYFSNALAFGVAKILIKGGPK